MTEALDPDIRTLALGRNWAAFTTMLPSGHPSTQLMWVDADEDHLLINTETHRQKFQNVCRDPRVTVTVMDAGNPTHYGEARGTVVGFVRGEAAREHIDKLSLEYFGRPYPHAIESERVILLIKPFRQVVLSLSPAQARGRQNGGDSQPPN
jgi:PPOX class probable F420-dependent enzyme